MSRHALIRAALEGAFACAGAALASRRRRRLRLRGHAASCAPGAAGGVRAERASVRHAGFPRPLPRPFHRRAAGVSSRSRSWSRRSGGGDPKRIAVTLDDGYRDNAEHALPVFRRHGVPFTIFVCPGFCDRTSELWWEALERIIAGDRLACRCRARGRRRRSPRAATWRRSSSAFQAWRTG